MRNEPSLAPNFLFVIFFLATVTGIATLIASNAAHGAVPSQAPAWVSSLHHNPQSADGYVYSVGTATREATREDAMSKSWNHATMTLVRTALPETQRVREESRESLQDTSWNRIVDLDARNLRLRGVEESFDNHSPWIVEEVVDGKTFFSAWRLLRWDSKEIEQERLRIADERIFEPLPSQTDLPSHSSLDLNQSPSPRSPVKLTKRAQFLLLAASISALTLSAAAYGISISESQAADDNYSRYQTTSNASAATKLHSLTVRHDRNAVVARQAATTLFFAGSIALGVTLTF
jgi:hypothetical protein